MGDVNLGAVKATLEFDTSEAEKGANKIVSALKLTQEQIIALANATEDQRVKMIAAFEGAAKGAEQAAKATEQWTESNQRAAVAMSGMHDEALKLNSEFEKNSGLIGNLTSRYEEYSAKIAQTGVALSIASGAALAFGAAVLGVGKQLFDVIAAASEYVEKLDKMALATGLSTTALETLGKAARETDVSVNTMTGAVTKLERAVAGNSAVFAQMGLSLRELKESSPEEMLRTVGSQLLSMTDVTERNALAMKLFGRSFAEVLPALEAYLNAGDRFINLTEDQKDALREVDAALDASKTAWAELQTQLGAVAASPEVIATIRDIGNGIRDLAKAIQDNRAGISWFFGLLTGAINPAGIGAKAGTQIRSLTETALQMGGLIPGSELPGVKPQTSGIFSAPTLDIAGPSAYYDELQKQSMEHHAEEEKLAQRAVDAEAKRQETIANLLQKARTSAAILGKKIMDDQFKEAEKHVKDQMKLVVDQKHEEERLAREFAQAEVFIARGKEDIMRGQLQAGTLSMRQEYDIRRAMIVAHTDTVIANINRQLERTTDPAQRAALEAQIAEWGRIEQSTLRAADAAEKYAEIQNKLAGVATILGQIGDLFTMLGGSADSMFGRIISGAQGAVNSIQGIVSGVQAFGVAAAKGDILGMISGGIGAVTGVVGVVKSIVGIFHKPEFKKIMNDVGKSWGVSISEGLAKEIEQIAKSTGVSRSLAELLDVSKIIGESGKDPREFTGKINDLMNAIAAGSVPAAQGLAELGNAFNQVADAALKSGNIGDKALVGLIQRARELGQVTPEMKEFIGGQLASAVDGVKKLLDVLPADTAAKAGSSGALLAATFNAIAAEQGIVAASAALGPAYDQLMQQITKAGLAIPEALQSIGRQVELGKNKEFQAASSAAAATSQVITGLGNAGYMDTGILTASADVAKQTFDQAKNAGATDKEAYQSIGGLLSDIKNASIQSGQEISGLAQELISGAQAEGVIIQGDQLSVLVDIRNILAGGGYTPSGGATGTGGGFGGSGAEGGGITGRGEDIFTAPPSVPYVERELRHFAGGSYGVQDFGAGTPAILHGREAVVTEQQLSSMSRTRGPAGGSGFEAGGITGRGSSNISFHPTFMVDPLQSNESREQLSQNQIENFVRQVISNPLFQQILREGGHR